jgi:hypothetical protein
MATDQVLRIAEFDTRMEEALRQEPSAAPAEDLIRFAPPATRNALPPLPSYVEHREDIDLIGKAASQAVVMQYDGAMRALESMGKELIECVKQSQQMAERALEAVKFVTETCDAYKEESKLIFTRIEHASALTAEVRKVCEEMRQKIAK